MKQTTNPNRKAGRPKAAVTRNKRITVHLSDREHEQVLANAKTASMSPCVYARASLLKQRIHAAPSSENLQSNFSAVEGQTTAIKAAHSDANKIGGLMKLLTVQLSNLEKLQAQRKESFLGSLIGKSDQTKTLEEIENLKQQVNAALQIFKNRLDEL